MARSWSVTLFGPLVTAVPTHSFSPRESSVVNSTSHFVLESKAMPRSVMRPVNDSFRIVQAGSDVHQVSTAVNVLSVPGLIWSRENVFVLPAAANVHLPESSVGSVDVCALATNGLEVHTIASSKGKALVGFILHVLVKWCEEFA